MICGKCSCEKKNVHISHSYQTSTGLVQVVNIPALTCDCETTIPQSVLMEIQAYFEKSQQSGVHQIQFEDL
ncbi:hypothetical protein [Rummeliibacillus pycnus]|uniref:hypothetical protein n=1 Tax=Rummeliibacillus pycnus TaxID=101070 RepID=UPI000C9B7DB8|nr:hypothetical protein [Rummeliibacillus pycnus]